MRKVVSQGTYQYREEPPQSWTSDTIPDQAPTLKYIIGAIEKGQPLNVIQSMRYDNEASIDDVDTRYLDVRHLTAVDIDRMTASTSSGIQEPTEEKNTP